MLDVSSVLPPSTTITSAAPTCHAESIARPIFGASFSAGMMMESRTREFNYPGDVHSMPRLWAAKAAIIVRFAARLACLSRPGSARPMVSWPRESVHETARRHRWFGGNLGYEAQAGTAGPLRPL